MAIIKERYQKQKIAVIALLRQTDGAFREVVNKQIEGAGAQPMAITDRVFDAKSRGNQRDPQTLGTPPKRTKFLTASCESFRPLQQRFLTAPISAAVGPVISARSYTLLISHISYAKISNNTRNHGERPRPDR